MAFNTKGTTYQKGAKPTLGKWKLRSVALASVVALTMMGACSKASKSSPNNTQATSGSVTTNHEKPPASLAQVGEYGEEIYNLARTSKWTMTADRLASLKTAAKQLRSDLKNASSDEDKLDSRVASLESKVKAKDRQATMREANEVTRLAADMTAPFNPQVPTQVAILNYEGRELQIFGDAKDTTRLKTTAGDMQSTWQTLRPQVESQGGYEAAKRFDQLVARVEAAKSPGDYARLATPVLHQVDYLEKVFKRNA